MKYCRLKELYKISFLVLLITITNTCLGSNYQNGLLDKNKVYKNSITLDSKAYPNSDCILVDDYIIEQYNEDGTGTVWDDTFLKVLTEKGKRENSILSFYFTLPYSTVDLKLLEIIKPDGTVKKIDTEKQSRVMIDDTQMNANIYNPNSKVLKVNIPDLQIGDIIRYVSYQNKVKARMPDSWSDYNIFEAPYPIKHLTLEIISPDKLPLKKINILDEIKRTITYSTAKTENSTTIHKWEVKDVPRMFPEPNMPPLSSVVQRLLISTISSWEEISKWYWNLCLPHIEATTEAMKDKVNDLIKDKKTDMEKVKAIFYYVSQEIRYMGITTEKEAPGYEPHDVSITFENKYGVCRDKAALLVAMLRLAEFKAYPVIVKVGPKMDIEVPMINFNHAIACVELVPDKYILMDPTDETTKRLLPEYLCNKSYLVAKPEGCTLQTTPIIPAEENLMNITTNGTLNNSGGFTADVTLDFNGINDNAYRSFFANHTKEENSIFFERIIRKVLPSAELISLDISPKNMNETSIPLTVEIVYNAEKILIDKNDKALLQMPWFGKCVGIINYVISEAGLKERKYPLETKTTCGYKEKLNINYPYKEYSFSALPKYKTINTESISYEQKLSDQDNVFEGSSKLLLKTVELSPKQYLIFKNTIKELELNRKKMPIISVNSSQQEEDVNKDDIRVLEKKTEVNIKNKNAWIKSYSVKFKILNYAGKKEFSEIKIPYNIEQETVNIDYAFVTDKSGKKQKITEKEINRMDAPWVGSAPRYPAEKILVVNLPGVEIGSIIEFKLTIESKNKPFFSDTYAFREDNPVDKATYTLSLPKDISLNTSKCNFNDNIKESITETQKSIIYKWSAKELEALDKEIMLPPEWIFLPSVLISTGTWKDYTQELNEKLIAAANPDDHLKQLAQNIIKNSKTESDKIIAVRDYVSKNIRLRGPVFNSLPLSSITKVNRTISDGYGNSADRAAVFYALLKCIGQTPFFVIVSDFPANINKINAPVVKTPQNNFFDQVLVAVNTEDMENIYLNDTDEYSILGATSNEFNLGIELNTGKPITITPLPGKENKIEVYYNLDLNDNTGCIMEITRKFYGNIYAQKNKMFEELRPEEKRRYYQSAVAAISQSAKPISNLTTNFQSYPGIENFKVEIQDYSVISNGFYYFKTPTLFSNIFNIGKKNRFYPYYQGRKIFSIYNIDINLPKSYNELVIYPEQKNISIPHNSGKISSDIKFDKSKWTDCISINIEPAILTPEQYVDLTAIYQKLLSPSCNTIMLKKM